MSNLLPLTKNWTIEVLVSGFGWLRYFRLFQNRDVKYFKKTLIELQLIGL